MPLVKQWVYLEYTDVLYYTTPFSILSRSELDNFPNGYSCDIIGLVQYVGRTERTRKRGILKVLNTLYFGSK